MYKYIYCLRLINQVMIVIHPFRLLLWRAWLLLFTANLGDGEYGGNGYGKPSVMLWLNQN